METETPGAQPTPEEVRAAVIRAARAYFDARRARVDGFVDKWFSARGTLRLHRHALGWDMAKAPANIALAPVFVGARLSASLADLARRRQTAKWLRSRHILLETAVMREVQKLVMAELLELPLDDGGPHARDDALAAAIGADPEIRRMLGAARAEGAALNAGLTEYAGSRAAVGEMTTALATIGAGAAAFHKLTPGALTLGPALAAAMTQSAAIAAFPLGATAGSIWYGYMTPATSPALVAGVTAGMAAGAAVFAAFAGLIADPVQRRLGFHRRRLLRLIDALERQFTDGEAAGFAAREHYVARLIDLMDAGAAAARNLRF
ncbi:hypothetical protein G5B40_09630 [Pikeienuella piscinae]|uniref:Uncharacterized protein n=1 Tax=Pikeienuella piscinae TaxID=2748098 RepID=A0A7L5BX10_9RHOB|nr:DUF6635 family protein [Pikeienuella piscinae]QIE55683.1 hypothetical protein G5B40_09630 [Pikeienuella piscinae]